MLFLLCGFVAPLVAVIAFSFVPSRTFSLWQSWSLDNYAEIFNSSSYITVPVVARPGRRDGA